MVNLRGVDDPECYGDARDAEKRLAGCDGALEIPLKDAFSQAELRGRKGLVILGDPGSGKTTHLKRVLLWCLRKGPETLGLPPDMLPVFLPLRELKDVTDGLDRFIQDQLESPHLKMRTDFGRRLLDRVNLLFLLDGLDEVADPGEREAVSGWIEDAFTDYPDCRFVVSCRFAGYNPDVRLGAKFLEMHVRPLSEGEAERFIRNWYAIVEKGLAKDVEQADGIAKEKADHLVERLKQPDFRARRVFELTRNPLLLTNICLVHRHRGTLPQGRAKLYEECIDVLLEHWSEAKKLKAVVKAIHGRMALQPAALWLHQVEGRTRASADELAPFIDPVIREIEWPGGSAKEFLGMVRDRSGLLTGWGPDQFGFMHLGFQEYLAAREIRTRFQQEMNETGRSDMLRELAGHFGESWWQEVALLLLALEDPPLFVPYMREVLRLPAFAEHADLVEMCLDDAVKPSPRPFLELLEAKPGKKKEFWRRQMVALRILERLDGGALETIMERLRGHPYDKIRQ
jgi:predicted NACHT family NTPase